MLSTVPKNWTDQGLGFARSTIVGWLRENGELIGEDDLEPRPH
jgi:hypothetical protein